MAGRDGTRHTGPDRIGRDGTAGWVGVGSGRVVVPRSQRVYRKTRQMRWTRRMRRWQRRDGRSRAHPVNRKQLIIVMPDDGSGSPGHPPVQVYIYIYMYIHTHIDIAPPCPLRWSAGHTMRKYVCGVSSPPRTVYCNARGIQSALVG